jgi:hypothetical protein
MVTNSQRICVGTFFVSGFYVVAHWQGADSAALLLVWIPVLYALATLTSERMRVVDELRASPLWFAVSSPKAYEHPFGYGRSFRWDNERAKIHAKQNYSENDLYYFNVDSGMSWYSGDKPGQQIEFGLGVRNNILEVERAAAQDLSQKCRDYLKATARCRALFALGWVGAVILPFFATLRQTATLLAIGVSVVVVWGNSHRWTMRDRTEDYEFLCPSHIHVYAYYPGDAKQAECYFCACGKIETIRDGADGGAEATRDASSGQASKGQSGTKEPTYEELLQRLQELQSENTTREQVERDTTSSEVISMGPYKLDTRVASYPQLVQFSRLEYEQYRLASEETFKAPPVVFLGSAWEVEISSVGGWVHGITAQSASDPLTTSLLRKSAFRHYQNKFGEPTKTGPGVAVWQSRSGQIDLCHDEEDTCAVIIGLTSASGAAQGSSPVS